MRPSISTGTGDKGQTGMIGKKRAFKSDARMHAIGTVDELNSFLGTVLAEHNLPNDIRSDLSHIQQLLFCIGAHLASPEDTSAFLLPAHALEALENTAALLEQNLPPLSSFILPGGCRAAAVLHQARAVCRRAERWLVELCSSSPVDEEILRYINRLSDYLFLAARTVNAAAGEEEVRWKHG